MTTSRRTPNSGRKKLPRSDRLWVELALAKLTLREKIGQMLMVPFFGGFQSAESAEYKALLREVEENRVGGLILHTARGPLGIQRSQVYPTAIIANELQRRAKIPLLFGADFELGTRMRLDEGTPLPSPMSITAAGDPQLAYEVGKITALEARAAGVHWVFAPVVDVNNDPANPIINFRSFGEDPREVAKFAAEYIRGVEEHGALATAKHFPGHGNVSVDSHLALATVPGSAAELDGKELLPFRAAIAAGVSSIMPGHLSVTALEPDPNIPATLSRTILTALLREQMKFGGLIITDAMEMGGVTSLFPQGEAAVRAVDAGADVILMPPVPDAALGSIEEAVRRGRISAARIDASVRRILAAKARLKLHDDRLVDVDRLNERFARPEFASRAQQIADRGVTLLRDDQHLLPLDSTRPMRVLLVALAGDRDSCPAETFAPEIQLRVDSLTILRADTHFSMVGMLKLPAPDSYDVAIAALFVRVADRKGHVGLPEDQRAFVNRLIEAGKPTVVASFGSPYLIERFPNAKTWVAAFSANSAAQTAAARALFGQTAIAGKMPVTVPGVMERGAGLTLAANPSTLMPANANFPARLAPAYERLDRAVKDGAFPGGVLAVGWKGELAVHPFGKLTREPKAARVTPDTIYDVASLTKVIVTNTAVMMLVEARQIDLDARVTQYLPEFSRASKFDPDASWRERITVRMLLLHSAGLAAHRDFYKQVKGKRSVVARVMEEPLVREPGTQIEYSDLGFILLGAIVETLTGASLEAFARKHIFAPLGMASSQFRPPKNLRARIAPTEHDIALRKRLVRGEVHDENAWAMGGIAGHAGLFSTAHDVAVFAQMMLNGGIYAHRRLVARSTVEEFTARQAVGNLAHALGWDVPVAPSTSGRYFSSGSYGHTGFTGTSLWIDPARELFVVLLTNRVHPTRANDKIRQVRPALHDAIVESLKIAGEHVGRQ
ncbi:MAG: glycoside hydrolase family 3 N-terminal domain-containing protein [Candidatus Acidiferrales bacterium]